MPLDPSQNLGKLLNRAAMTSGRLTFYAGDEGLEQFQVPYSDLLDDAKQKARLLCSVPGLTASSIVLLHFDSQRESLEWFWAATLAGLLPAISTPLVNDTNQRKKHLSHLQTLLRQPVTLTTKRLVPDFLGMEDQLRVHDVESLGSKTAAGSDGPGLAMTWARKQWDDIAVLMLTSGSTGDAKAVPLRHGQMLKAVQGKKAYHGTEPGDAFLNWVGIDHVASLLEIHLHAMSLGSDQVHVPASELLRDPLLFVRLLDAHKVAYTFAPNFFLTQVRDRLAAAPTVTADLSPLKALISGGEANVVATCETLARELRRFGVDGDVIRPGFGMTETCAGCIYSLACPSYDLGRGLEFASLGQCIPGVQLRLGGVADDDDGRPGGRAGDKGPVVGELQVSGPVVFDHYFNDAAATERAFTADGWFITGDLAWIDDAGCNLAGRNKDTIIVNGVKWSATALETAIEEDVPGVVPSYTVAFPHRAAGSPTEDIAVVYAPAFRPDDDAGRFETATAVAKTVALMTGRRPARLIPLPPAMLEKSSLGKISRARVRAELGRGAYAAAERDDAHALERHRRATMRRAETPTEKTVLRALVALLELPPGEETSVDASIFELGITSFTLIRLKAMLQEAVGLKIDMPMSVLLKEPTTAAIAAAIDTLLSQPPVYNPIVPLQPHGSKTPLFCIHPGSGDILVFIALAAHLPTRPVYALRTRGYNPDERLFHSIAETAETYARHIREVQPEGPYAVAGYSLGSTLAYEVAKQLEAEGQEVRFLASIDYPPHIADYVDGLDWIDVLLHIAFFLELIDEPTMVGITPELHRLGRAAALDRILSISDAERVRALAIDADRLALISDIAENFRKSAEHYKPIGTVPTLDVFVADPPTYAALDRRDWRENKLGRWTELSRSEVRFHDCPGIHAKMLNMEHIVDFARIIKAAMKKRGV